MKEKLDKMYILASISQSTDSPEHLLDFNNSFVGFFSSVQRKHFAIRGNSFKFIATNFD